ncbi:acetyl-CoA hydrolase/transferase family protein [Pseudonocardia sp. RS010]|uniref:acetyl-CoA hydrolase/transferase family protein n=1 Tax=Pseudonocardia sp. RS010 TaxID=3385979 RepID=UPI0039A29F40
MNDWTTLLRPNDLVVVAQGVGEPTPLLEQLLAAAPPGVEAFVGLSHSAALTRPTAMPLVSFGGLGPLGRPPHAGRIEVIPAHFDDLPRVLPLRGRDLVLAVQVTAIDATGGHCLGMAVDHTYPLLERARLVVAEVNAQLPRTTAPEIDRARFAACLETSRPLPVIEPPTVTEDVHGAIAAHVTALIPDGATLQLGIGAVPTAIGHALTERRGLGVRSTLAGDWLLELATAGALREGPDAVVISEAAGSPELYKFVAESGIRVCPVHEVAGPAAAGDVHRFVAVNSALQVDLSGQVNAEELPSGFVGGIGGQAEYLRGAQRSAGGRSIVALPAAAGRHSRIVPRLDPPTVTTLRSGVDFVITEYGVADLRGRGLRERAALLTAVAAPEHRAALAAGGPR